MKQLYKKFERRGKLIGIIILDIDAIIFFLLLGIYLIWRFSWKVACFYFPVVALIIWLANLFAVRLSNMVFRKNIKEEDEREFFTLFKNDYIKDYYADANRKPLFNQIVIN